MAWKKIDDDQAVKNRPYSSFLADGLTKNINSYPDELKTGGCVNWNTHAPPTWASYGDPQGAVVVINCGQNAREIAFRVGYQTVTANGTGSPAAAGKIVIQHLTTRAQVSVDVPPSLALNTVDLTLRLSAGVVTGPQAFLIAFQSYVLESIGDVDIYGGSQSDLYLHPRFGSAYTLTTGKKYEVIDISTSNNGVMAVADARKMYQIGYISTVIRPQQAAATAIIWPELETVPQYVVNYFDNGKSHYGTVYELGAIKLFYVAYEVTQATEGTQIRQLSHALAYSLQSMNNALNNALTDFRPDVANNACDANRLGSIMNTFAPITHTFCVQDDVTADLVVSFHAIRLGPEYTVNYIVRILDSTGAVLAQESLPTPAVGRMAYASTYTDEPNKFRAMAGISSSPTQWGMIDSIPLVDTLKGTPLRLRIRNFTFQSVVSSYLNTYTIEVLPDGGSPTYVFGYHVGLE